MAATCKSGPGKYIAKVVVTDAGEVRVRVDDESNPEFWLEVTDTMPEFEETDKTNVANAVARLRVVLALCNRAPTIHSLVEDAIKELT